MTLQEAQCIRETSERAMMTPEEVAIDSLRRNDTNRGGQA